MAMEFLTEKELEDFINLLVMRDSKKTSIRFKADVNIYPFLMKIQNELEKRVVHV
jgi:hypothetical protein